MSSSPRHTELKVYKGYHASCIEHEGKQNKFRVQILSLHYVCLENIWMFSDTVRFH